MESLAVVLHFWAQRVLQIIVAHVGGSGGSLYLKHARIGCVLNTVVSVNCHVFHDLDTTLVNSHITVIKSIGVVV